MAVTKRWANLRDAFTKSKRKLEECKKSGSKIKIKKYVYSDQMQFLNKVFQYRKVAEKLEDGTVNIDDGDAGDEPFQEPFVEITEHRKEGNNTSNRKRRRPDEVELKMLKALEEPKPSAHMSFFQGIQPHLNKFDNNEVLEFQMGVLKLISKINEKKINIHPLLPQTSPCCHQNYTYPQYPSFAHPQPPHSNRLNSNCNVQAPFPPNHPCHCPHLNNSQAKNIPPNNQVSVQRDAPVSQGEQTTEQLDQQFGRSSADSSPDNYPSESPSPSASLCTDTTFDFS